MADDRRTGDPIDASCPPTAGRSAAVAPRGGRAARAAWLAAVAVVVTAALVVFSNPAADTDLWGHLRFGLDKIDGGALERFDRYSFTAQGLPWFNHEWLAEAIGAAVYRAAGERGLLAGKMLLGAVIGLWLVLEARRRGAPPLAAAVVGAAVVYGLWPGTMFRPQLFSYLMFALLLGLVHRATEGRWQAAVLFPPVMALWANLHGGFVVGLGLLCLASTWQLGGWLGGRRPPRAVVPVVVGSVAAAAAVLANPYGVELPRFLARTLSRGRPIGEWAPLPLAGLDLLEVKVVGVAALALAVVAAAGRWRGVRGWEVAWLVVTAAATLRHQRHAPFLLVSAAPFLAWAVSEGVRRLAERSGRPAAGWAARRLLVPGLAAAAALQAGVAATSVGLTGGRVVVDPTRYPVAAVRFLAAQDAGGRLVLPFEWGEYALWHLAPGFQVSFDGRFETVYPEAVRDAHLQAALDPAFWGVLADRWRADALLAPAVPEVLALAGRRPEEWRLVWADPVAAVLVRRGGAAAAVTTIADGGRRPTDERPLAAFP